MRVVVWLLQLLFLVSGADGLKFLVFNADNPGASKSHVILMDRLGDLLVDAGHEVVRKPYSDSITAQVTYMPFVNKVSFAKFSRKSKLILRGTNMTVPEFGADYDIWSSDLSFLDIARWLRNVGDIAQRSCAAQLADEEFMKELEAEKFDFGLVEYFDPCGAGLFQRIGLTRYSIVYSSQIHLLHARHAGIPTPASFVPENTWPSPSRMTIGQRFWNLLCTTFVEPYVIGSHIGGYDAVFASTGKSIYDLMAEAGYIFVNTDEFVDFPKPISHKIVNIGGIGMKKILRSPPQLDQNYQSIFENAERGVVLVSFGSLARTVDIPPKTRRALFAAFREFPDVSFIVKYENGSVVTEGVGANVFLEEWLPQRAILAHPKTLAFITHAGQNSIAEATYAGVPMITIPLYSDQYRNSEAVRERGVGVILRKQEMTKTNVVAALQSVLYDKSHQQNADELSRLILAKPMDADTRFVAHCEFGAQFDVHKHLDLHGRNLSFIEYYNIDILLISLAAIAASVKLVLYLRRPYTAPVDSKRKRQ